MKNKEYRYSKLKHQIFYEKNKGKKVLYWNLTPRSKEICRRKIRVQSRTTFVSDTNEDIFQYI